MDTTQALRPKVPVLDMESGLTLSQNLCPDVDCRPPRSLAWASVTTRPMAPTSVVSLGDYVLYRSVSEGG